MTITHATITVRQDVGTTNGNRLVTVTFADGSQQPLFAYYSDELRFYASEFEGRTREEALALRHDRDVRYLRS